MVYGTLVASCRAREAGLGGCIKTKAVLAKVRVTLSFVKVAERALITAG
jgi:hypothetical protein